MKPARAGAGLGLLLTACGVHDVIDVYVPRPDAGMVVPAGSDGWGAAAGTGRVYILNTITWSSAVRGFDLDSRCDAGGNCGDNALGTLGDAVGSSLRGELLGGRGLIVLELSGLELSATGSDGALTIALYPVRDEDDPFFPANNFQTPPGHSECCRFQAEASALAEADTPKWRLRAGAEQRHIRSLEPAAIELTLSAFVLPRLRLERAQIELDLSSDGNNIDQVRIGGVVPLASFDAQPANVCEEDEPNCVLMDRSFADLLAQVTGQGPDIDLDGDGLECAFDTDGDGLIDRCCDGELGGGCAGFTCIGASIARKGPHRGQGCASDPRMLDGFSIAIQATGVAARIVGIAR